MNTSVLVFKISENPSSKFYRKKIKLLEIKATFNCVIRGKVFSENFNLLIWGDLIEDVLLHYRKNDYIVVEGILKTSYQLNRNNLKSQEKKIEITVLDIYLLFPAV